MLFTGPLWQVGAEGSEAGSGYGDKTFAGMCQDHSHPGCLQIPFIVGLEDPREIWNTLESAHRSAAVNSVLLHCRCFFRLTKSESESTLAWIGCVRAASVELSNTPAPVTDLNIILVITDGPLMSTSQSSLLSMPCLTRSSPFLPSLNTSPVWSPSSLVQKKRLPRSLRLHLLMPWPTIRAVSRVWEHNRRYLPLVIMLIASPPALYAFALAIRWSLAPSSLLFKRRLLVPKKIPEQRSQRRLGS